MRPAYDLRMLLVLWLRDLLAFLRQPSRVVGALLTVLLLWLAIGAGIAPSFAMARGEVGYVEYFYPGVMLMLQLQVCIGATMSVIEDRREGFLQGVLVAPGSRAALVLGKTLGGASSALIHAALFVLLAPFAGFAWGDISWGLWLLFSGASAVALAGLGFTLAWALDSIQGYHVVMNLLLFPLWILSGAMFPVEGLHPALSVLVRFNPMSYAMSGLRRSLYGGHLPDGLGIPGAGAGTELLVVGTATLAVLALACEVTRRRFHDAD